MDHWLTTHEPAVRLGAFVGIFALIAAWEMAAPRRRLTVSKARRWFANVTLVALNTLFLRAVFPTAAVGVAALAAEGGWGLFNRVAVQPWIALVLSVVLLDLVIYLQHVMFHAVPALWKLHMVHHADLDFDVTTGARFHPAEILLSMVIKLGAVVVLGPPVVAVLVFEVLLNATAMFNHGNVRLRAGLDRVLRWIVVTPDMHRVHHSVEATESNSNFGFNLPWWDRLLGTYRDQPAAGQQDMTIGLAHLQQPRSQSLGWMLVLPVRAAAGSYAINRREWP